MNVFVTGATGFVGQVLVSKLIAQGHTVKAWVRSLDSARSVLGPPVDLVAILIGALTDERYEGPLNAVSPNPLTNAEFTKSLAGALKRPALLPVPAVALRAAFGEGASVLTASQRVRASVLTASQRVGASVLTASQRVGASVLTASQRVRPGVLLEHGYPFLHREIDGALAPLLQN